jgi:BASS family bile acid:Na+ symporter
LTTEISIDSTLVIRSLTIAALSGLLLAVGLRLNWGEVAGAVQRSRLLLMLAVNFIVVPLLAAATARVFHLGRELTIGMMLLAAAPFAPVVPVFARMARADLALAAGLTALFPFLSALLTPLVCVASLRVAVGAEGVKFEFLSVLGVLVATITLPLAGGVVVNYWRPSLARRILRPIEVLSEAIGAVSLAYVTAVEFKTVLATGWKPLLAMVLVSELSMLAGYVGGGVMPAARRVVALGTSNRNIALAVLIAISSFPGTPVVGAVVANGLLLILLGLLHVAWWRFTSTGDPRQSRSEGRLL